MYTNIQVLINQISANNDNWSIVGQVEGIRRKMREMC